MVQSGPQASSLHGWIIETLHQGMDTLEDNADILFGQPPVNGGHENMGIYPLQNVLKRRCFLLPDLVNKILLPVEVGGLHHIIVDKKQGTDAHAGKSDGHQGTKATQTHDPDHLFLEAGLYAWAMQGIQQMPHLFRRRRLAPLPQPASASV